MQDDRVYHEEGSCCGACEYALRVTNEPTLEPAPLRPELTRSANAGVTLTVTEKGRSPKTTRFASDSVTVGRSADNDLVLPKGNVSKRTCRFFYEDDRLCVVDLKSTCGTYVNGRRILGPTALREGDRVFVGDFVLAPFTS